MARGDRLEVEHRIAGSTVTYLHHGIDLGDGTVVPVRMSSAIRSAAAGWCRRA
jgi:hypothetical protein